MSHNVAKRSIKAPDKAYVRDAIFEYEKLAKTLPQADYETIHSFTPGLYTREMRVPADVMLTGMIHKTEHLSIFLQGRMIVTDGEGGSKEIEAPIIETGLPGIKRAGYTLEDVRWITVHPTEETDIDTLEAMLITNDYSEVAHLVDQRDYQMLAAQIGYTDEDLAEYAKIPFSHEPIDGVTISESKRHGKGVFVTKPFAAGEVIAHAIKDGELTAYSRYCNHSAAPNAYMQPIGGEQDGEIIFSKNFELVALRDVDDEEITVDYRDHSRRIEVRP